MVDIDECLIEGGPLVAFSATGPELNLQVRVYKTAHGYRLLVESQTLKPDGSTYELLARAFSCDASYLELAKTKILPARLTPKPEAESGAGTCRYLGTIGNAGIDEALAPLIQLHDPVGAGLMADCAYWVPKKQLLELLSIGKNGELDLRRQGIAKPGVHFRQSSVSKTSSPLL